MLSYWVRELPGSPNVRNKYRYNVEKLSDGSRIYLMRPTRLNKGCDFVIHCENFLTFKNGNSRPPSQGDLIAELEKTLKSLDSTCRRAVLAGLIRVYNCEEVNGVVASVKGSCRDMLQAERMLKLAKWLFIEQDVTYWTESGREMLRGAIEVKFGRVS